MRLAAGGPAGERAAVAETPSRVQLRRWHPLASDASRVTHPLIGPALSPVHKSGLNNMSEV